MAKRGASEWKAEVYREDRLIDELGTVMATENPIWLGAKEKREQKKALGVPEFKKYQLIMYKASQMAGYGVLEWSKDE